MYSCVSIIIYVQVISKQELPAILNVFHDNATTGGHFVIEKTLVKISE